MSILVVGASHRSAPADVLDRLAASAADTAKLRTATLESPDVTEAVVLVTCNRVEVYAHVERFHGAVEAVTELLAGQAGSPDVAGVAGALYVHYDIAAVTHLMSVASGLRSMVVGEAQILGQVRDALRQAQEQGTVGPVLNGLFQHALRAGKRAHHETGIDRAGRSVVSVALDRARDTLGDVTGRPVAIVGAGSVAALAATGVRRAGAGQIVVLSRTHATAARLAESVSGRAEPLAGLASAIAEADVLVSCTGATGVVIGAEVIGDALARRSPDRPLVVLDLAMPHDVDRSVADLPGVTLVGLAELAADPATGPVATDIADVEEIIADSARAFAAERTADQAAPTVVALRAMAAGVLEAELARLWSRLPELDDRQRAEIAHAMRRQVDKLLHEPTVRVKQYADRVPESSYAAALAELFALDPAAVDAVSGAATPGEPA